MVSRRQFLTTIAAAGAGAAVAPIRTMASRQQSTAAFFGLHPFIEAHPEAVFIMKTNVDQKMNESAKKDAGLAFGRSVFVPMESGGMPVGISIPVKPNIKTADPKSYKIENIISHATDAWFCEGVFEGMKELGIAGKQFHIREVTRPSAWKAHGWVDMASRVGADLRLDLEPSISSLQAGRDYNWVDIPNGIHSKRLPYLEPINTPNTFQMEISKFKAHGMGLTLCCKNLQGSVAHNYQQFCADWGASMSITQSDRVTGAYDAIKKNFDRHLAGGVPRWDKSAGNTFNGGLGMETWATRTLDNISVSKYGLHIMEGIYGRDGQGNGDYGPNPVEQTHTFDSTGVSTTGKAWDWMSNVIVFGKDIFRVDIIGLWMGGHEAGNLGLYHCALDRGLSNILDPRKIPVYIWEDGKATLTPLESLKQTPLLTYYLTRNYNGQTEKIYHLCNEPVDYSKFATGVADRGTEKPDAFVLHQNRPNPFNPTTSIEYALPRDGHVRIEVYNESGQLVDVLADGFARRGSHMAVWNAWGKASGTYFYRFRYGGFAKTGKMVLLK